MVIYIVSLDNNISEKLHKYTNSLSEKELRYWSSIQNLKFKKQYHASKILTRLLLSKYSNWEVKPHEWILVEGEYGKPELSKKFDSLKISFNLSHCDTAFTMSIDSLPTGIDIESFQFYIDDNLAKTVFSIEELAHTKGMKAEQKNAYFIQLWTIKESFSKQIGLGINMPFQKFSVQKINNYYFKVNSSNQIKNELLTKNIELSINGKNHSISVSARPEQFSEAVLKPIDIKDKYFYNYSSPLFS